jgi:DNA invertase Pin-like site-specific DNA recombinase
VCERFVGLVRVSTTGQEASGLGLEAGRADLDRYIESVGGELVHVFTEVESGAHDDIIDRPTLLEALRLCKRRKACLLVPKVDRLVRSTSVHTDIKRMKVPFRAVDNPVANEFTLDILVAVAAQEARAISDRTKKALAAYKARGGVLGAKPGECPIPPADRARGSARGRARLIRDAIEDNAHLVGDMKMARAGGASLRAIANRLNAEGHTTRTGTKWTATQVMRVLGRESG